MVEPDKKQVLNDINEAIRYSERREKDKALIIFDSYGQNLPVDPDIMVRFAELCSTLEKNNLALDYLYKAGELCPDDARIPAMLGNILLDEKQYREADTQLRNAVKMTPGSWQLLLHLGIANSAIGNYDDAIHFIEKARSMKPGSSEIYENLAACMFMTDRNSEAQDYARKSIKLNPKNYNAWNLLGMSLSQTGDISEAIKCLEKAIKIDELNPNAYVNLTTIKNFSEEDRRLINRMEKLLEKSMPSTRRSGFCFALGKIFDSCKEGDKAFYYINQANLLSKPGYDENPAPKQHIKSLRNTYSTALFEEMESCGNQSEIPVFIVGMPRSGTTLIEQIITTHPDAEGAGELEKMEAIADIIGSTDKPGKYRAALQKILNRHSINELSSRYLEELCKNREKALRITDKTTNNYFYLGLITILFPNARIIHVFRSPLDTCISCYFQYFRNPNFGWSFDPRWITNTYHSYRQTMDFWRSVLPSGKILDIKYEKLVDDPEPNIRHILDNCGLDWEPACLDFYKTRNIVKTASQMQVRQPLYTDSVQRWKRYGTHVAEFATGLEEYLGESDKQQLLQLGINPESRKWWRIFNS